MKRENKINEREYSITLEAEGTTKEDAVGKIYNKLRKDVYKEVNKIIVKMEPKAFYVDELNVEEYTEKFLFFFMPKKKEKVKIKATVVVDIKYVEI